MRLTPFDRFSSQNRIGSVEKRADVRSRYVTYFGAVLRQRPFAQFHRFG